MDTHPLLHPNPIRFLLLTPMTLCTSYLNTFNQPHSQESQFHCYDKIVTMRQKTCSAVCTSYLNIFNWPHSQESQFHCYDKIVTMRQKTCSAVCISLALTLVLRCQHTWTVILARCCIRFCRSAADNETLLSTVVSSTASDEPT